MGIDDDVEAHEDFVTTYGDDLQAVADALVSDRGVAEQLVDRTLTDLWRERASLRGEVRAGWARRHLAQLWAMGEQWPTPSRQRAAAGLARTGVLSPVIDEGSRRLSTTLSRVTVAGVIAVTGATIASTGHGWPVQVGGEQLKLLPSGDGDDAWLQLWHADRLLAEFSHPVDEPTTVTVPWSGDPASPRTLIASWVRGEWTAIDWVNTPDGGVCTGVVLGLGLAGVQVSIGLALVDGPWPLPMVVRSDGQSFLSEVPRSVVGFRDTPERGISGYHVSWGDTLVLAEPVHVVMTRHLGHEFVLHLGPVIHDSQLLAVRAHSGSSPSLWRNGVELATGIVDSPHLGPIVMAVCRPPASPGHPVEVRWFGSEGLPHRAVVNA
ncbi:hypothetical protein [Aestuariimicrobium sp. T2.26MG-19.2B]|uniref:hypothetical protein n=1 Tax=Aestuariimicrobium sp. T2.26MG-19.2B TaxID=3040679 RepID=UPI0024779C8E|nr:hypothetical protein [Aestuariimicrobium sp. T2.26MG-19.2B]CAI9408410.1 hypothetical protein AESSP_02025 [Aestuariimicrobium sp. T2.26MG-19.2B]